ncbi:SCO7613 C-terminal domain-containing membrane protein [Actinocorallia sp. A-T 12471]|uniref:SCO7613 C-terminal domain-containing membrane protein n=1 Tax=Actinocorallia sp. A-T 12471 TaxID=3089813 RepID=UPI0029CF412D|nr:hypothetical protein [Actinocorallia sp. A-T 12471]MDX6741879.1 hypothetical protein [Actinocorallia sp. A-T 12471]
MDHTTGPPPGPPPACPNCGAPVADPAATHCALVYCKAPLTGPVADELAALRARIAVLDAEEHALRGRLMEIGQRRAALWAQRAGLLSGPRPELGRRSVRDLLLVVGVGLVGIAALVFTVVSWGTLGPGARAAVLTVLAGVALALPWPLARRGVGATAESAAGVGLLLTLLECYAVYQAVERVDLAWFLAISALAITVLWAVYARWAPVRLPAVAAVVSALFPAPLLVAALDGGPLAQTAAFLTNALAVFLLTRFDVPVHVRHTAIVTASVSFVVVFGLLLAQGLFEVDGNVAATLELLPFLVAAVVLASLWTSRIHPFYALPGAAFFVLALFLPLANLAFREDVPTALALAALPPLALAVLRPPFMPDVLRGVFGTASETGTSAFRMVAWLCLGGVGVLALTDVVPVLLSRHEIASGWTPVHLTAVAAGLALQRLPYAAAVVLAAGAAAIPSAAGFGAVTTALWFAALFLALLAGAMLSRGKGFGEGAAVLVAAWTAVEHAAPDLALPVTAGTFLAMAAASARARTPVVRVMTGVGAVIWSGVTAHYASEAAGRDAPVEALTLPVAVGALLLGHVWRASLSSSWLAYGPGLSFALLPTLVLLLDDPGLTRPLLLGAGSLAVLLAGIRLRLQAPAVYGAVFLVLDAAEIAAPYALRVWEAVPQWLPIGAVGILLLVVGGTYERHLARARRLSASLGAMR